MRVAIIASVVTLVLTCSRVAYPDALFCADYFMRPNVNITSTGPLINTEARWNDLVASGAVGPGCNETARALACMATSVRCVATSFSPLSWIRYPVCKPQCERQIAVCAENAPLPTWWTTVCDDPTYVEQNATMPCQDPTTIEIVHSSATSGALYGASTPRAVASVGAIFLSTIVLFV